MTIRGKGFYPTKLVSLGSSASDTPRLQSIEATVVDSSFDGLLPLQYMDRDHGVCNLCDRCTGHISLVGNTYVYVKPSQLLKSSIASSNPLSLLLRGTIEGEAYTKEIRSTLMGIPGRGV